MHFICTKWHTDDTERRKYEHAFYAPQKVEIDCLLCWLKMRGGVGVSGSKVLKVQDRWLICVWL